MIIVDSLAAAAEVNKTWRAAMSDIEVDPLCLALAARWDTDEMRQALRRDLALPRLEWAYNTTAALLQSYAAVHAGGNLTAAGLIVHDGLVLGEHLLGHIAEDLGQPLAHRSYGIPQWEMLSAEGKTLEAALLQAEEALANKVYARQPSGDVRLPD